MHNKTKVFTLTVLALACAGRASAQDCGLKQAASLPITIDARGEATVPIQIAGKDRMFLISPTAGASMITPRLAAELALPARQLDNRHQFTYPNVETGNTGAARTEVYLPDVHIGAIGGHNIPIRVVDTPDDLGADGELGLDLLIGFDIELDFKDGKVNLFSQDHCDGKVVYWADSYGVVPLDRDWIGNLHGYANLDGQSAQVSMEPAQARSQMQLQIAQRMYGVPSNVALLTPRNLGWKVPTYTYPLQSLTVGDVAILHPDITLYDDPNARICDGKLQLSKLTGCSGDGDVVIGLPEIQKLRIYFAVKELKAYVTAADAHR